MRILIVGATPVQLAAATRLRRLDEAAKIIVIDEAGESPGAAALRSKYRIDLRPFTRFISADMGYANVAMLEDALTRHVYQEEFDKIINQETEPAVTELVSLHVTALDAWTDADIAAHLAEHVRGHLEITIHRVGGAHAQGRRIADEIYGRTAQPEQPVDLRTADVAGFKLALFGHTEKSLNAQQAPHIYSVLPIQGGFCKLIYDDGGNILGFAALGHSHIVESSTSIMATLVKMGGNIHNMVNLGLSDNGNPLPVLGKIAQNVVEKRLFIAYADEIGQPAAQDVILLDVRHQLEFMDYRIDGSINIPLENLRESIYRLERSKEIITICGNGKESYLAARILMGHGFKTRHLTGGLAYGRAIITPRPLLSFPQEVL